MMFSFTESTNRREQQVRWMIRADLLQVLALDRERSRHHWTADQYVSYLRQTSCIGMVVDRIDGHGRAEIAGAVLYELRKRHLQMVRLVYQDSDALTAIVSKMCSKLSYGRREKIIFEAGEEYEVVRDLMDTGAYTMHDEQGRVTVMWSVDVVSVY